MDASRLEPWIYYQQLPNDSQKRTGIPSQIPTIGVGHSSHNTAWGSPAPAPAPPRVPFICCCCCCRKRPKIPNKAILCPTCCQNPIIGILCLPLPLRPPVPAERTKENPNRIKRVSLRQKRGPFKPAQRDGLKPQRGTMAWPRFLPQLLASLWFPGLRKGREAQPSLTFPQSRWTNE